MADQRPGVLQLIDTLDPGGAERLALLLANHLPRERFRSALATTRRPGALAAGLAPDVAVLHLSRRRRVDPAAAWRLRRFVARERVALVHAHGTSIPAAVLLAATRPGLRIVAHLHSGRLAAGPPTLPLRLALRRADLVVTVSEELAAWARRWLAADQVVYLPNFVETTAAPPAVDLPGASGGRVVCLANLRPEKDHATLLAAFARVAAAAPQATLLLAGAPTDPATVTALGERAAAADLAGRVVFLGRRDDADAALAACDIGVLASASEGFPLALLEYGAAGLATVATAVGQAAEVLDGGRAGLLVPPGDADALADALLRLLDRRGEREQLAARLRSRVADRYSPGPGVAHFADAYAGILR